MSELELIAETASGLLGPPAQSATFDVERWTRFEESGLSLAGIPEEVGGSGGALAVSAIAVKAAAYAAAPLPVAETAMLGGWLLAAAELPVPRGPLSAGVFEGSLTKIGTGVELHGSARAVPWARVASCVALIAGDVVVALDPESTELTLGENLAGEPRDDLVMRGLRVEGSSVRAGCTIDEPALRRRGALARSISIAGAAEAAATLTFDLVATREQFGRPIASFQAVQQMVAELAAETAATTAAVDAAVASEGDDLFGAAAKVQAGRGATAVARLAHQLHGAIGMTEECLLHLFTRRLWAWRDEYGSETVWARELGRAVAAAGAERLWSMLTND